MAIVTLLAWKCMALPIPQTSEKDRVQAAESFKAGQALFEKGEYIQAAAAFERAYFLAPHPSALANIGFCYDEAGDYPRAVVAFRKYMLQPNPETPKDTLKIERYLQRMKSKVGDLVVKCSPGTCDVTVDHVPYGVAPDIIVLLAGPHVVTVAPARGDPIRQYHIDVPKGGQVVLDVDFSAAPPLPEVPRINEVEPTSPRLGAPFWVASSITVLGLATTIALGVLNTQNRQDFEAGGSVDPALKERGERLNLGVGLVAGATAAAAATAIVLAIVDVKRNRRRPFSQGERRLGRSLFRDLFWIRRKGEELPCRILNSQGPLLRPRRF
jgi:tetratricopeptide (TPR) repeat protein